MTVGVPVQPMLRWARCAEHVLHLTRQAHNQTHAAVRLCMLPVLEQMRQRLRKPADHDQELIWGLPYGQLHGLSMLCSSLEQAFRFTTAMHL